MINSADATELEQHLRAFGQPNRVEVLICDSNAIYRGKWFPGQDLEKLMKSGTNFPISVLFGDLTCETPSALLQPPLAGDPDGQYAFVPGSLKPVPWRAEPTAQIQLQLAEQTGFDPRSILDAYLQDNPFSGFVALEGEFVLGGHTTKLVGEQVYSHQALDEAEPFLARAYDFANHQNLELTSVLPEYGDGQFEVNLRHRASPLVAADEYLLAKRVIKAAATSQAQTASFMALPGSQAAGNGCHIHISLGDDHGDNVLADDQALSAAANGILSTVGECVALLAPHANSYRRIALAGEFNAPSATWGENHRGAMLRIPKSDAKNRRFEFRLAGADVNPYLLTLYTLGALRHGLALGQAAPLDKVGTGEVMSDGLPIPTRWHAAIDALHASAFARGLFGDRFIDTYVRMKRAEEAKFHALVSDVERGWSANVV